MEEQFVNINSQNPYDPLDEIYSKFSRQNLIETLEEQKKTNERLSKEIIILKEKLTSERLYLELKDKEISILNNRLEDKSAETNFIRKYHEDYKSVVKKSNEKQDFNRNPLSNVLNKFFDDTSDNNNILYMNMKNQNESKSSEKMLKNKRKRKNKVRDPNRIKKPCTPFFLFSIDQKRTHKIVGAKFDVLESSKICGNLWREMTPEQKEPYNKLYQLNVEKYQRDRKNLARGQEFIIEGQHNNIQENRDIIQRNDDRSSSENANNNFQNNNF